MISGLFIPLDRLVFYGFVLSKEAVRALRGVFETEAERKKRERREALGCLIWLGFVLAIATAIIGYFRSGGTSNPSPPPTAETRIPTKELAPSSEVKSDTANSTPPESQPAEGYSQVPEARKAEVEQLPVVVTERQESSSSSAVSQASDWPRQSPAYSVQGPSSSPDDCGEQLRVALRWSPKKFEQEIDKIIRKGKATNRLSAVEELFRKKNITRVICTGVGAN